MAYVGHDAEFYSLRIRTENGVSMLARAFVESLMLDDGGMGKSTVLLRATLEGGNRYAHAPTGGRISFATGMKTG